MITFQNSKFTFTSHSLDKPILNRLLQINQLYFDTDLPAFPKSIKFSYKNSTFIYSDQIVQISILQQMIEQIAMIFYYYFNDILPTEDDLLVSQTLKFLTTIIKPQVDLYQISAHFRPFILQKDNSVIQKQIYQDYSVGNDFHTIYHSVQYKNICLSEIGAPKFLFGLLHRILHNINDQNLQIQIQIPIFDELVSAHPQKWILDKTFQIDQEMKVQLTEKSNFISQDQQNGILIFSQENNISTLKIVSGNHYPGLVQSVLAQQLNSEQNLKQIQILIQNSVEMLGKLGLEAGDMVFQNSKIFSVTNLTVQMDLVEKVVQNLYYLDEEMQQTLSIGYNYYASRSQNCVVISQNNEVEIEIFVGL